MWFTFLLPDILQPSEDEQRALVDAAEAGFVVGLRARQIPSAGSGDTLESDTRELYISAAGDSPAGSRARELPRRAAGDYIYTRVNVTGWGEGRKGSYTQKPAVIFPRREIAKI